MTSSNETAPPRNQELVPPPVGYPGLFAGKHQLTAQKPQRMLRHRLVYWDGCATVCTTHCLMQSGPTKLAIFLAYKR